MLGAEKTPQEPASLALVPIGQLKCALHDLAHALSNISFSLCVKKKHPLGQRPPTIHLKILAQSCSSSWPPKAARKPQLSVVLPITSTAQYNVALKKKRYRQDSLASSGVVGQTLLKGFVSMPPRCRNRLDPASPINGPSLAEFFFFFYCSHSFMCQKAPSISPLLQEVTRYHIT